MEPRLELEQEDDGRWLADFPSLPGVMAYGSTPEEARANAKVLRLSRDAPKAGCISCWPPFLVPPLQESNPGPRMLARVRQLEESFRAHLRK